MSYLQDAIYAFRGVAVPCILMALGVALSAPVTESLDTPAFVVSGALMLLIGIVWACIVNFFGRD